MRDIKIIAKIRERIAELFMKKEEFDAIYEDLADTSELPTLISDLINNSQFIEEFNLTDFVNWINALYVDFDEETGIITIYTKVSKIVAHIPFFTDNPLVKMNSGGLTVNNNSLASTKANNQYGIGYIENGWENSKNWTLKVKFFSAGNPTGLRYTNLVILPESSESLTYNSIMIRKDGLVTVYTDGISETKGTLDFDAHYAGACNLNPVKLIITKEDNIFTIYSKDSTEDSLSFEYIFDETDVTLGIYKDTNSNNVPTYLYDALVLYESDSVETHNLLLPSTQITTNESDISFNAVLTGADEGESIWVTDATDNFNWGYGRTDSNGEATVIIPNQKTTGTKNFLVQATQKQQGITVIQNDTLKWYDSCTPSDKLSQYAKGNGKVTQQSNGVNIKTQYAKSSLFLPITICSKDNWEYSSVWIGGSGNTIYGFYFNTQNSMHVWIDSNRNISSSLSSPTETVQLPETFGSGSTIKIQKIDDVMKVIVDDEVLITQTVNIYYATTFGNGIQGGGNVTIKDIKFKIL